MDTDEISYLPPGPMFDSPVPSATSPIRSIEGATEVPLVNPAMRPYPVAPIPNIGMGDEPLAANPNSLAFSLLAIGAGAAIGGYFLKNVLGGVAGALYGGSFVNAVRAASKMTNGDSQSDRDAMVSGTYAVAAAAAATFLLYKSRGEVKYAANESSDPKLVGAK